MNEEFNRQEWEQDPYCVNPQCLTVLDKEFDEEWPNDDRALLCRHCLSRAYEELLKWMDDKKE